MAEMNTIVPKARTLANNRNAGASLPLSAEEIK